MREKLTDQLVKILPVGIYWDTHKDAAKGLLLQVTQGGSRAYRLNYRRKSDDRERRVTIGDVSAWPIVEARKRAAELRRLVDAGGDPRGEMQSRRDELTVSQLIERYVAEALPHKAPRTQADYRSLLYHQIEPALGGKKISAVTRADVERLHRKITAAGRARRANATKTMLHGLFEQAMRWQLCDANPATHIRTNQEHHRIRYLNERELAALLDACDRWQQRKPDACDAIRLALMTGCRRGELLAMTWACLDLDETWVWRKAASDTKQRREHITPLAAEAVELLLRRLAEREIKTVIPLDTHVFFPGLAGDKARGDRLARDWVIIRKTAGLGDSNLHFHDLRHSFASWLVGQGLSLPIIGQLLGHSKPAMTARYSHVALTPQRAAVEIVGRIVGRAVKK